MTAKRLTKQVIDELIPRDADYVAWCGKLRGFGCRVRASGHKSFVVMYRDGGRNATTRKVTIGAYGKLTVEQAREAALAQGQSHRAARGRSATVWELDIAPDELSATFKYILRANRKACRQARGTRHC